ncbi:MAG: hypothetical protein FWB96_01230 [Defluviitaleaceae bacterium]|nr:hypothetical protein [Defluviitaleaceae bacterium]MCL2261685.1 hypothetical protein [Defluviitaleaceae bacterium]
MNHLIACPCCGENTINELGEYEICSVCDWEDDPGQSEYPDDDAGANTISLNEARANWAARNTQQTPIRKPTYAAAAV